MYSLIIFIILGLIQGLFIYSKWSDINDYMELTSQASGALKLNRYKSYNVMTRFLGILFSKFKRLLIIPCIIILFINLIISLILGGILNLIF